jgi:PAS domain S-box-containing protein
LADSLTLPPEPQSAGHARRFLRARLDDLGRDDLADAATLLVSEVVTNVVLHAATWLEVHVRTTPDGVRVDVLDGSVVAPAHREYAGFTSTGHGLGLVEHLADDFGVDVLDTGKSVWFTLDFGVDGGAAADQGAGGRGGGQVAGSPPTDAGLLTGRTAPPVAGGVPPPGAVVVLRGLPIRLWVAARQHHEAALRELYLRRTLHEEPAEPQTRQDIRRAVSALDVALEAALAAVGSQGGPGQESPSPLGQQLPVATDLEIAVTTDLTTGVIALQGALDAAERLAREGELLVLPALSEVVAVRDWVCEQVVAQVNGVAPTPWSQAAAPPLPAARGPVQGWDPAVVLGSSRAVVAGDDTNRILAVSPAAAALLMWEAQDLVGRRVIDVIPASLREAHVASFTRYQTTGEGHVLGRRLELPVLRSDGTEVLVRFLLERSRAPHGRSVYLAWLDPLPGG